MKNKWKAEEIKGRHFITIEKEKKPFADCTVVIYAGGKPQKRVKEIEKIIIKALNQEDTHDTDRKRKVGQQHPDNGKSED